MFIVFTPTCSDVDVRDVYMVIDDEGVRHVAQKSPQLI